jgi:hypothetical protein
MKCYFITFEKNQVILNESQALILNESLLNLKGVH